MRQRRAGPRHGRARAEVLGISRVMIAPAPSVLCADVCRSPISWPSSAARCRKASSTG